MLKKYFIIILLFFINFLFVSAQTEKFESISFQDDFKIIESNTNYFFQAKGAYLQISCTGLNDIELTDAGGNNITYYEKNKSTQNIDFLYENLVPGQTYYIKLRNSYFEKAKPQISLIEMQEKLTLQRVAKKVRPYQDAKIIHNNQSKQIRN